ncbi:hypothetical protein D3C81_317960 [compost metagenome]
MPHNAVSPATPKPPVLQLNDARRKRLYQAIRGEVATFAGLEALARLALSEGEATEEVLENMATLACEARQRLDAIGRAIAELATAEHATPSADHD